MKIYKEAA